MACFRRKDSFVAFDLESLVELAKFYADNLHSYKLDDLGHEVISYIDNVWADERFANLHVISNLAKLVVDTNKHITFHWFIIF